MTLFDVARRLSAIARPLAAGLIGFAILPAAAQDYNLTVLHVGDVQSRLEPVTETGDHCAAENAAAKACYGGVARLAAAVRSEKAKSPAVIVVDAGNQFTGTPFYSHYKQRAVSETMNLVGFDAMSVGHREFTDGSQMLGQFVRAARFPLLGANINTDKDEYLRDLIFPILVIDRGGQRLGILGYSSEQIASMPGRASTVRVDPIEAALPRWIKAIQGMGVNKIIAVSTAGLEKDKQIAAGMDGIDVIVGGNSRTLMGSKLKGSSGPYPLVAKGPKGQPVLIVHAGEHGRYLGRLDVTFDRNGVPKSWKGDPIELNQSVPEDQSVKDVVSALAAPLAAIQPAAGAPTVR